MHTDPSDPTYANSLEAERAEAASKRDPRDQPLFPDAAEQIDRRQHATDGYAPERRAGAHGDWRDQWPKSMGGGLDTSAKEPDRANPAAAAIIAAMPEPVLLTGGESEPPPADEFLSEEQAIAAAEARNAEREEQAAANAAALAANDKAQKRVRAVPTGDARRPRRGSAREGLQTAQETISSLQAALAVAITERDAAKDRGALYGLVGIIAGAIGGGLAVSAMIRVAGAG